MTPTPTLYHALLRPCILQTLRATGYHSIRPSTLDAFTDLAARYLFAVCRATALHAIDNHNEGRNPAPGEDPYADADDEEDDDDAPGLPPVSVVDVRMALEEVGAFGVVERFIEPDEPNGQPAQQSQNGGNNATADGSRNAAGDVRGRYNPDDDTRGVDEFVAWFAGAKCRAIRDMVTAGFGDGVVPAGTAVNEGEVASGDYLHALMSKHSKTAEESKFNGTILGKGNDAVNEVAVEGGEVASVQEWSKALLAPPVLSRPQSRASAGSRPPSSGLSSVGDRLGDDRDSMELS